MAKGNTNKGIKPQISKIEKERLARIEDAKKAKIVEKQKKKVMIVATAATLVAIVAIIVVLALIMPGLLSPKNVDGTYEYGTQRVTLKDDKTFSASLEHNITKSGTYTVNGREIVFTVDSKSYVGSITSTSLVLPTEWDDGHGHSAAFKKQ